MLVWWSKYIIECTTHKPTFVNRKGEIFVEMNENNTKGAGSTVNTTDIVRMMSELSAESDRPMSQVEARHALHLLRKAVIRSLKAGLKVQLTSFISFVPTYRAARKANNIKTNEPLVIPEGIAVTTKIGKLLKSSIKDIASDVAQTIKDITLSKKK